MPSLSMHITTPNNKTKIRGFTLTELTIVLIIISLLLGGMLMPLSAQRDLRANSETQDLLNEINNSLMGFAIANGYFPCPAISSSNGLEDRAVLTLICNKDYGILPWTTLGVKPTDSWGRLFYYRASPNFSSGSPGTKFSYLSGRDITIKTRNTAGVLTNLSNTNDIPIAFFSTGKNGYWGTQQDAAGKNPDSLGINDDEDTNSGNMKILISRENSPDTSPGGEFDDLVAWISPGIIFAKMTAAGRLP
ncbi:MAG: prepilin-type N-terminal cleavage/methylation domain-containing protein [Azonexus sp.]